MKPSLIFLLLLCLLAGPAHAGDKPDKLLESGSLTGKLQGFRWGDYLHAEIRDGHGRSLDFFIDDVAACFMAQHAGEPLEIRYNRVSRYFAEAGGYAPANVIVQIKTAGANYLSWKKNFDSKRDFERCEQQIEKHTLAEDAG